MRSKMRGGLSPMQDTVLQYAADGMSTKQIARELNISPRTVEAHKATIFKKLRAQNICHAAAIYAKAGLIFK